MEKHSKQSIEQLVIKTLQRGAILTTKLIGEISTIRSKTTKQGVYRVLRKLKVEEKIIIYGKSVSLNLHWIKNMNEFFSLAEFYYSPKIVSPNGFLGVKENNKIVYFFENLNLLDSFWSHALYMFNEILDQKEPIFVYNPHEWFSYIRQETEQALVKTIEGKSRQVLITVSHNESLDKELKKKFTNTLLQYDINLKGIFKKQNYYFNVFGDCLVEVFIDPKTAKQIDEYFERTKNFDDKAKRELLTIVSEKGKNKLVISRNKKKAEKYKKILSKNFYIIPKISLPPPQKSVNI